MPKVEMKDLFSIQISRIWKNPMYKLMQYGQRNLWFKRSHPCINSSQRNFYQQTPEQKSNQLLPHVICKMIVGNRTQWGIITELIPPSPVLYPVNKQWRHWCSMYLQPGRGAYFLFSRSGTSRGDDLASDLILRSQDHSYSCITLVTEVFKMFLK